MTTEPQQPRLPDPRGYLRGLRLYRNGHKVADYDLLTQAVVDQAAVAATLQAAWPARRAVTARELEVWRALSAFSA